MKILMIFLIFISAAFAYPYQVSSNVVFQYNNFDGRKSFSVNSVFSPDSEQRIWRNGRLTHAESRSGNSILKYYDGKVIIKKISAQKISEFLFIRSLSGQFRMAKVTVRKPYSFYFSDSSVSAAALKPSSANTASACTNHQNPTTSVSPLQVFVPNSCRDAGFTNQFVQAEQLLEQKRDELKRCLINYGLKNSGEALDRINFNSDFECDKNTAKTIFSDEKVGRKNILLGSDFLVCGSDGGAHIILHELLHQAEPLYSSRKEKYCGSSDKDPIEGDIHAVLDCCLDNSCKSLDDIQALVAESKRQNIVMSSNALFSEQRAAMSEIGCKVSSEGKVSCSHAADNFAHLSEADACKSEMAPGHGSESDEPIPIDQRVSSQSGSPDSPSHNEPANMDNIKIQETVATAVIPSAQQVNQTVSQLNDVATNLFPTFGTDSTGTYDVPSANIIGLNFPDNNNSGNAGSMAIWPTVSSVTRLAVGSQAYAQPSATPPSSSAQATQIPSASSSNGSDSSASKATAPAATAARATSYNAVNSVAGVNNTATAASSGTVDSGTTATTSAAASARAAAASTRNPSSSDSGPTSSATGANSQPQATDTPETYVNKLTNQIVKARAYGSETQMRNMLSQRDAELKRKGVQLQWNGETFGAPSARKTLYWSNQLQQFVQQAN